VRTGVWVVSDNAERGLVDEYEHGAVQVAELALAPSGRRLAGVRGGA
jgi:hypothetical protein